MIALDDENYGIRSLALIDAPTKRKRSAEEDSDSLFFGEAEGPSSPAHLTSPAPTHHKDYRKTTTTKSNKMTPPMKHCVPYPHSVLI